MLPKFIKILSHRLVISNSAVFNRKLIQISM